MTTASAEPKPDRRTWPAAVGFLVVILAAALVVTLGGDEQEPSPVAVFPDHRVLAASPKTTVTLRGIAPDEVGDVTVTGRRSGPHEGEWRAHADDGGATFVPDEPFAAGERVNVNVGRPLAALGGGGRSWFVVMDESDAPRPPYDKAEAEGDAGLQAFASRPELRPPAVEVRTPKRGGPPGHVFVAPKRGASQQGPMILDEDGETVWFNPLPGDVQAFDFRAQTYRGDPVLTWWQGRMATYRGYGEGRILDSAYRPVATVEMGNGYPMDAHEMQLTEDGTALVMSYVVVPWDLSSVGGRRHGLLEDNVVQEIDVETGEVLFEWHTLGSIPLTESHRPAPTKAGQPHDPWHLNSIELDRDGDLIVSARHADALYKIDRETGDVVWRLGGKASDFQFGEGAQFALQHDARVHEDGTLSLFDNVTEDVKATGMASRGIVLELDEEAMTAELVREFEHPDGLISGTQGSMQVLDGEAAFVGWGGRQPFFSEFDADGGLVFDARFRAENVESYRAFRIPWEATPEEPPRAVLRPAGGGTAVHVSWNGATEVVQWRVRPAGGRPITAERSGFETRIRLRGRPQEVQVEALGEAGEVIGTARAS